ncbi:MAG: AAA family ATPase [Bacteroidota bacterium]
MTITRIAILGPESTGKSQLAEKLATHFQSVWVREFARDYLQALDRPYTLKDVEKCREGQIRLEEEALTENCSPVFFDTDTTINFDIWLEERFGIEKLHHDYSPEKRYDFYLLTYPDLPFVADPLRENPHKREYLFNRYKEALATYGIPFRVVKGTDTDRLKNAIDAIKSWQSTISQ